MNYKVYYLFDRVSGAVIFQVQMSSDIENFSHSSEDIIRIFRKHPSYKRVLSELSEEVKTFAELAEDLDETAIGMMGTYFHVEEMDPDDSHLQTYGAKGFKLENGQIIKKMKEELQPKVLH